MCVITTTAVATGLGALASSSLLAGTAAGAALTSTTATVLGTVGANAALSAGLSAGVSAAFGARGRDLGRAALIGGAVGGGASALSIGAGALAPAASSTTAANSTTAAHSAATANTTTQAGESFMAQGLNQTNPAVRLSEFDAAASQLGPVDVVQNGRMVGTIEAVQPAAASTAANPAAAAAAKTYAGLTPGQWLAAGGVAASAVGQGISSKMEADANAAALKRQAALESQRAAQVRQSAAEEAQSLARERRRLQGSQRTAAAANGVLLESSRAEAAPNMLEQDAAMESAWDTEKMLYNANLQAWGYSTNAATLRYNAASARKSGNLALSSGLVRGGILGAAGYYSSLAANEQRNATLLS